MPAPRSSPVIKLPAEAPVQAQVAGTAAFSKFMRVLQLVADSEEPLSVGALMRATGYPRPTVHRIALPLWSRSACLWKTIAARRWRLDRA